MDFVNRVTLRHGSRDRYDEQLNSARLHPIGRLKPRASTTTVRTSHMNSAQVDRKPTLVAALVGLFIGTVVAGMLGLTFSGHMQMANVDPSSVVAR